MTLGLVATGSTYRRLGVPGEDGRHTNQLNFAGGALSSGLVPIAALAPLF